MKRFHFCCAGHDRAHPLQSEASLKDTRVHTTPPGCTGGWAGKAGGRGETRRAWRTLPPTLFPEADDLCVGPKAIPGRAVVDGLEISGHDVVHGEGGDDALLCADRLHRVAPPCARLQYCLLPGPRLPQRAPVCLDVTLIHRDATITGTAVGGTAKVPYKYDDFY